MGAQTLWVSFADPSSPFPQQPLMKETRVGCTRLKIFYSMIHPVNQNSQSNQPAAAAGREGLRCSSPWSRLPKQKWEVQGNFLYPLRTCDSSPSVVSFHRANPNDRSMPMQMPMPPMLSLLSYARSPLRVRLEWWEVDAWLSKIEIFEKYFFFSF